MAALLVQASLMLSPQPLQDTLSLSLGTESIKPLNPSFVSVAPIPSSYRAPLSLGIEFFSMKEDGMDLTSLCSLEDAGSWEPASRHAPIWEAHRPLLLGALPASSFRSRSSPFTTQPLPVAQHSSSLSSCSSPALGWKRFITVCVCPLSQVY